MKVKISLLLILTAPFFSLQKKTPDLSHLFCFCSLAVLPLSAHNVQHPLFAFCVFFIGSIAFWVSKSASLSLCLWGTSNTWADLHFLQYIKASMPSPHPVTLIITWYRLILTQYHHSTNHCCPTLTQYTASSPRNANWIYNILYLRSASFFGNFFSSQSPWTYIFRSPIIEHKRSFFMCFDVNITLVR